MHLYRRGLLEVVGFGGAVGWQRGERLTGAVFVEVIEAGPAVSIVEVRPLAKARERGAGAEIVVEWSACRFGGRRPWWRCFCDRRAVRLYEGGSGWRCRRCYRLAYLSQRQGEVNRAIERARAIRDRVGAAPSLAEPLMFKPKWMRWATWERLRAEEQKHNRAAHEAIGRRWGW